MHACGGVCAWAYTRCMLTEAMHACVFVTHAHYDCCEAMHVCACFCVVVHKAHAHCDWCEAIDVCACLCVLVLKVHGHSDWCEGMHACAC
jgi:hypothetical protein